MANVLNFFPFSYSSGKNWKAETTRGEHQRQKKRAGVRSTWGERRQHCFLKRKLSLLWALTHPGQNGKTKSTSLICPLHHLGTTSNMPSKLKRKKFIVECIIVFSDIFVLFFQNYCLPLSALFLLTD